MMQEDGRNLALRVLRTAKWLKGYPPELAEHLVAEGRLVRLNVGEWAQAEGDARNGLFVVIDGLMHSYCAAPGDREVMIGVAEPGSVLGHATRHGGGPRLVTAVCVEPGMLLELSESALDRVAARSPEIWRAIAGAAYASIRSALRWAAESVALPPRQRIAARLLAGIDEAQRPAGVVIRLTQELLGEMTGLTRKTVNLHLCAFEREGLIDIGYGRMLLIDVEGLRGVANS